MTLPNSVDLNGQTDRRLLTLYFLGILVLELNAFRSGLVVGNITTFFASGLIILHSLTSNRLERLPITGSGVIITFYFIFCASSALWSPAPADTLIQVVFLASAFIAASLFPTIRNIFVVRFLVRAAFFIALLSFAMVPLAPDMAFQPFNSGRPELRGIFDHQQRLGNFMCLVLGLLVIAKLNGSDLEYVKERWRMHFLLVAGVILVCAIAAFARFYILFGLLSLFLTFAVGQRGWSRFFVALLLVLFSGILVFYWEAIDGLINSGSVDLTFTGRTRVWERSLGLAWQAPEVGHGFASFFDPSFDAFFPNYRAPHAHNSFIQAFFETGFVGLTVVCLFMYSQLRIGLLYSKQFKKYSYSFFVTSYCVLCGLTGVFYAGKLSILLCLAVLFAACEAKEIRQASRQMERSLF